MRKFVINVNGKKYEVEVEEIFEGQASDVAGTTVSQIPTPAPAAKPSTQAPAPSPAASEASAASNPDATGSIIIKSPMPGNIWEVKASPGDTVKKGDVILILEAMKMENEIMAPQEGKIVSIPVSKGSTVNAGDILATLE